MINVFKYRKRRYVLQVNDLKYEIDDTLMVY